MEIKLNQEELEAIIKKHLENEFGHEVEGIELNYQHEVTIKLGAKKQVEYQLGNYPWATQTHPNTSGTLIPRGGTLATNNTAVYDGADTPASKPWKV